ncbi:hypothetical protein BD408DRAFT_408975 [Parasitella parasitica]|nr:hypothetical protein BD408DRAFT_408975 [Parasitella parasitica]
MGQTVSHRNNKNFGSTVFGYTTTSASSIYLKEADDTKQEDKVLFKPFLYGLASSESSTSVGSVRKQGRTDSGFLLSGKDSQLWKDLMYVDQTYYPEKQPKPTDEAEMEDLLVGDTLTLKDISSTSQNLQEVDLSKRGFGFITPNIGLLSMIRRLDLSHNQLKELPEAIGHLQQLENLSVSHNQITFIPDTICHLVHLVDLNLSHNQLKNITPFISHLHGLQTLQLGHNQLEQVTVSVENLISLTLLDLSYNPVTVLPAEITQLPFLRRLRLDGCSFTNSLDHPYELTHNPPSLLETCARYIVKNEQHIMSAIMKKKKKQSNSKPMAFESLKSIITDPLYQYLSTFNSCSHCHGPYFESFVTRGRWVERNDVWVPLEYRLCSAHWSDESDRVYAMFSVSQTPSFSTKKGSETVATTSFAKSKPGLPILHNTVAKRSSSASIAAPAVVATPSTSATRRSCFNNRKRSPSITAPANPPTMVLTTTTQLQINEEEPPTILDTTAASSATPSSALKRWRFKVRNNSSLFLKNHRLC